MRFLFIMLLVLSCQKNDKKESEKEVTYFSKEEVIGTLIALQSFIDYPEETKSFQKNLNIDSKMSFKLILPLHALYDEKVNETISQMYEWKSKDVLAMENSCMTPCHCEFYLDVLERNPLIIDQGPKEFKAFVEKKMTRTKEDNFRCLNNMPPVQNLLNQLKLELKDYESDSIL